MPRIFTGSSVESKYACPDDLSWDRIEASCGKTFDGLTREDIYDFFQSCEHDVAFFEQSFPLSEVEDFREKLRNKYIEIIRIINEAHIHRHHERVSLFRALQVYLGADIDGHARRLLHGLKHQAQEAARVLEEPQEVLTSIEDSRSQRAYLLKCALGRARSRRGGEDLMRARRWGLNPSPRSGPFRRFLSMLFEIEEPTEDELRNAQKAIEHQRAGRG